MRIVGISALLARTQEYIGADPAWANILGEERRGMLTLYQYSVPENAESWRGHYIPWARISPIEDSQSLFVLSYYRDNRKWQDLEVAGHLEDCLQAIKDNAYGIFFNF